MPQTDTQLVSAMESEFFNNVTQLREKSPEQDAEFII